MDDVIQERELLQSLAQEAKDFVTGFRWVPPIARQDMGFGIGGVLAIYLFDFSAPIEGTDSRLWVVVGDLPSAYLVVEGDDSPREALSRYCDMMGDWYKAVESGGDMDEVFPVEAPPTLENAEHLKQRLVFIRNELMETVPDIMHGERVYPVTQ